MILTDDQNAALEEMQKWLYKQIESGEDCFFSLSGSAGTGKTSLIAEFIKDLSYPFKGRICVSAPTHKARKVISNKSGCEVSETVQSLLGLKPDLNLDNFDVTDPIFSPIGTKKMSGFKLLIIDEASMVNVDLYQVISEDAIRFKVKVLYIGDLKQLPPINKDAVDKSIEILSKTLTDPKNKYNLTQVVRQEKTNPLIELLDVLRLDIDNGTDKYLEYLDANPVNVRDDGQGYEVLSNTDFKDVAIRLFKEARTNEDKNYVRYIAWTNQSIKDFNTFIRRESLQTSEALILEEALLSYSTMPTRDGLDVTIVNSEDYVVKNLEPVSDIHNILVWKTRLFETDSERYTTINIVKPTPENYKVYLDARESLLNKALIRKGKAWKDYYAFRDGYALMDNLFEGKKMIDKKNIDYGYGITIHKSQGSTFDTIVLNGKDVNKNSNDIERRKLWYVALSRASKKVYIVL